MNATISVLLPVYLKQENEKSIRYLERAIDSIFIQNFPDKYEIILIDDGSAVPVIQALENSKILKDERIRVLRQKRNNGIIYALNYGISKARYHYIARLDADDAWQPKKIEKQMERLLSDPDLTIIGTGMTLIPENKKPKEEHIRPANWHELLRFFIDVGCPFPHGSIIALKSIYQLLGGYPHDTRFYHCEDYALWGKWMRFFKASMIEEALYDYTVSDNAVSTIHSKQQSQASGLVNKKFTELGIENKLPEILEQLSERLGLSVLQTGVIAYRMWHYRPNVNLPKNTIELFQELLVDRHLKDQPYNNGTGIIGVHNLLRDFNCDTDLLEYKNCLNIKVS